MAAAWWRLARALDAAMPQPPRPGTHSACAAACSETTASTVTSVRWRLWRQRCTTTSELRLREGEAGSDDAFEANRGR